MAITVGIFNHILRKLGAKIFLFKLKTALLGQSILSIIFIYPS
jgi:hypothetical protein